MKKGLHLTIAVALISGLALVLCGSGCDEDGGFWFGDGGGKVRSLEQARAIADPIADVWNPDADNILLNGIYVDEEGLLLTTSINLWQFIYEREGLAYMVVIQYDGTHWETEETAYGYDVFEELPSYSDDHVKFLMGIATAILIDFLGTGDYMYSIGFVGSYVYDEIIYQAAIAASTKDDYGAPPLAWVDLNADTGEVIGTSWAP